LVFEAYRRTWLRLTVFDGKPAVWADFVTAVALTL